MDTSGFSMKPEGRRPEGFIEATSAHKNTPYTTVKLSHRITLTPIQYTVLLHKIAFRAVHTIICVIYSHQLYTKTLKNVRFYILEVTGKIYFSNSHPVFKQSRLVQGQRLELICSRSQDRISARADIIFFYNWTQNFSKCLAYVVVMQYCTVIPPCLAWQCVIILYLYTSKIRYIVQIK